MSAKELALRASALPDFAVTEDHARTVDEIAALYPDATASAADLSAHGFRESWQRAFLRPASAGGHPVHILNIVTVYDQETGSGWALGHNRARVRSLPVLSVTALPVNLGDESYGYSLEFAGPVLAVRSITLYIRIATVSYTLVETGVAADVDPAALIDLARSELAALLYFPDLTGGRLQAVDTR